MDEEVIKVTDVQSFLEQLSLKINKEDENVFYRGQSKCSYDLSPSVLREMPIAEDKIYDEIIVRCSHEFDSIMSHSEILSKMQHYGVPTRMMDVTTNPLIALYFVCEEKNKDDGAVYILRPGENGIHKKVKSYDSDAISILSSLPRFTYEEKEEIKRLAILHYNNFVEFNSKKIIKRLLHEIKKEKPAFENIIIPKDLLINFIFIPKKNNARIIRQNGAFLIFGLSRKKLNSENFTKIIVDGEKKESIIKQLELFGLSKAEIYPELDKVAEFLRQKPEYKDK